jgi:predicted transcriptional regulator
MIFEYFSRVIMGKKQARRGVLMDGERIRRVLRLRELGKSQSEIAREVGISRAAVQDCTRRAQAVGLSAEEAAGIVDEEVRKRLNKNGGHRRQIAVELNVAEVITELSQKGVTLELLYRELVSKGKMPCSYSTFCRRVKEHEEATNVVLKRNYAPGEYWFVDYIFQSRSASRSYAVR